ncbi:Adenine deaminase [Desulfonauticus submarinus]|uniref:Adenine deaminase n=1 Tax=Desulfonauticus submarinus TaxID=206665 RepID=A0A1H0A2T7_9BACT|nr:adenine deaminase [Desulfonauticus submarinus]SDN27878.1 Adenine deaminase [Desulfonauticus submarinus]
MNNYVKMLEVARGEAPADLVLKNVQLINVLSGEIYSEDIAIYKDMIVGVGKDYKGKEELDYKGKYACPGFIEGHIHIESSFLSPWEFAKIVGKWGTCCVVCDPHEIANVLGIEGIEIFIKATDKLPVDFYFMASSCVPASHLETSGAILDVKDIKYLFKKYPQKVLGLAEMMNFPGTYLGNKEVLDKLKQAENKIIDGHAPLLGGKNLNAYILAGPKSDHECLKQEEALEKLRKGMTIFIREGSTEKNLKDLIPIVNFKNGENFCLVTDDKHADELFQYGHINYNVKKAIDNGLNPILAIKMATINPARYFGLKKYGAIAPGYYANIVILDNLKEFNIVDVYLKGKKYSSLDFIKYKYNSSTNILNCPKLNLDDFKIIPQGDQLKVIKIIPHQIITEQIIVKPKIENNNVVSNINEDIIKLAVIERHKNTGNIGLGFVKGLKLKKGAIASTIAHDSHNLVVAGCNDKDMLFAANYLRDQGGGIVFVEGQKVISFLSLPFAGLMSLENIENVVNKLLEIDDTLQKVSSLGSKIFMHLSFLALPVIPKLKLTDKGLVDVEKFEVVSLFV